MQIGEATRLRILDLCQEYNITVNRLANLSGITQSTLNNIVSRRNKSATLSTIKKLCDGLDITIQDYFENDLFMGLEQELQ